jgi:hypothetical protein
MNTALCSAIDDRRALPVFALPSCHRRSQTCMCFTTGLCGAPLTQPVASPGGTLSSTYVSDLKGNPVIPMKRTRPCCFNCCSAGSVSLMI